MLKQIRIFQSSRKSFLKRFRSTRPSPLVRKVRVNTESLENTITKKVVRILMVARKRLNLRLKKMVIVMALNMLRKRKSEEVIAEVVEVATAEVVAATTEMMMRISFAKAVIGQEVITLMRNNT
jgi:hypothetical protein